MTNVERLGRPAIPRTRSALEKLVGQYANHYEIPQARIRNWISFMILAGALERVQDDAGASAFVVKGGVALELRLRLRARATRDFDACFRERFGEMLEVLDAALAEPYGDFCLARKGVIRDLGGKAKRIEVQVQYRDKPWATVQMEVSAGDGQLMEAERVPATDLSELGLDGPVFIHCLSTRYQIAQKIHAVTSPPREGRQNERYRDLVDLWLLRALRTNLAQVRRACEDVFRSRAMHAWPPEVHVPGHWAGPFARLAGEVGLPTTDVDEAAEALRAYIAEIALADSA
ncbi:nucleotidyl transferase AbiEii/AbiGii toxin family protein [Longimicrobium sp.]|uniref:nucleotidyl transferase AbiEii/AbiGii toxin family protein n=1 Tax=Longimicrobium sp. TaxID=2029185 RepID=UPI002E32C672|nr:nucleotidyl transferase AbiEii/AbiGii toxin family protein [Longimicrobium sp.]HEX6037324.1 nucleotidyl transferase AbiEii/AbiGii toxin family protein [Longimicrobium sp.]